MENSAELPPCFLQNVPAELTNLALDVRADNGTSEDLYYFSKDHLETVLLELKELIPLPWIVVPDDEGLHVLLLSRGREKSVQRRASFFFDGREELSVHQKSLGEDFVKDILMHGRADKSANLDWHLCSSFVQRVMNVVQRFKSYEVCVGVNDQKHRPLWEFDKGGVIDNNVFGEMRYIASTFRPSKCDLLVSTAGYLKKRCPVCIKTVSRFRMKMLRRSIDVNSNTPNIYLDRSQLLGKVALQQRKLKSSNVQVCRLKKELERVLSQKRDSDSISEELLSICLVFTASED